MFYRNSNIRNKFITGLGLLAFCLLPYSSMALSGDEINNKDKRTAVAPSSSTNMLMVEGTIYDKISGVPLSGVTVVLLNRSTQETIHVQTGNFGMFSMELSPNMVYELAIFKENYHLESSLLSSRGRREGTIFQNWYLQKLSELEIQSIDISSDARIPRY